MNGKKKIHALARPMKHIEPCAYEYLPHQKCDSLHSEYMVVDCMENVMGSAFVLSAVKSCRSQREESTTQIFNYNAFCDQFFVIILPLKEWYKIGWD